MCIIYDMCEFFNNNASLFSVHNRQSIHHFLLKNREDHRNSVSSIPIRLREPFLRLIPSSLRTSPQSSPCHCEPVSFPGVAIPQMFRQPKVLGAPPYPDTASPCHPSPTQGGTCNPSVSLEAQSKKSSKKETILAADSLRVLFRAFRQRLNWLPASQKLRFREPL